MNEVTKTTFTTQDLNEAAFIWSQKSARMVDIVPRLAQGGGKEVFKFCFELEITNQELKQLLFDYQNGDTRVEPSEFVKNQNNLRDSLRRVRSK